MTTTSAPAVDRITADVRQLVGPIHIAVRGKLLTHPPLLEQLRAASVPSSGQRSEARRPAPGSRPPARLDPVDCMAWIYVGIAEWRVRLHLGSPPRDRDWQLSMLRMIAEASSRIDTPRAEWLAVEVHEWWHDAAVFSGWKPTDLLKLR